MAKPVVSYNETLQKMVEDCRPPKVTTNLRKELEGLVSVLPLLPKEEVDLSSAALERIIGTNDLLPVNYLEKGVIAARAIGRIVVESRFGELEAIGTGFLVAPGVLMTNNHVIATPADADSMYIEFNYERSPDGQYRRSHHFRLEAGRLFITSDAEALDYSLIAVAPRSVDESEDLSSFGFLRLAPKTVPRTDSFVSVIQHPDGAEKQVSIRENRVLVPNGDAGRNRPEALWYASDTAPGSSGSPVFDDNWRVVALHHAGVPERRTRNGKVEIQLVDGSWIPDEDFDKYKEQMIRWTANEGIRIPAILNDLRRQTPQPVPPLISSLFSGLSAPVAAGTNTGGTTAARPVPGPAPIRTTPSAAAAAKVRPLSFYDGRGGYNPDFLGRTLPLPRLQERLQADVAAVVGSNSGELKYEHFSVVLRKSRRLALYTAVNIDGSKSKSIDRNDDWYFDPRISLDLQVGNNFYTNEPTVPGGQNKNYFDRGHLVRRLDPVWGSAAEQQRANEDSFHWTNCAPQFWQFNQSNELWQGLENFILTNTDQDNLKATVFTGPLFADDDPEHRGVQVPRGYWKLVVVTEANRLYASAYMVSQERWVTDIPFEVRPVGAFKNFQLSISKLESLTGLDFGATVRNAEVYHGEPRELRGLGDLNLPRRGTESQRPFGRFRSLEDFLSSYQDAQRREELEALAPELERRRRAKKKQQRAKAQRDVVEVEAIVREYPGTESSGRASHQHIIVAIQAVIEGDPDVERDLRRVVEGNERVFVSVRYGDRMGLAEPVPGIDVGEKLHIRGEWIPREKAYAHGGERVSVLHFTHHPLGYICDEKRCYD